MKNRKTYPFGQMLLSAYYRARQQLGLEPIAQKRIREQRLLDAGEDPEAILRKEDEKRLLLAAGCLSGMLLLMILLGMQSRRENSKILTRPGYGENAQEVVLELTVGEEEYQIPLTIDSMHYSEAELELKMQEAWEGACRIALGDNPGWDQISRNLSLVSETGVAGITVSWFSEDSDEISPGGVIHELEPGASPVEVRLTATLNYEEWQREEEVLATIVPPERSSAELRVLRWTQLLKAGMSNREESTIFLPSELDGETVTYPSEGGLPWWLIPVLGGFAAAAVWILPEQKRKEALGQRERELELAYSELIWKLTVLLGAGMTVRGAWERIVSNYQQEERDEKEKQILYEEMQMTLNSLSQGVYEEKAYAEFGRRCGLPSYLRLGSLLETNVRQGRKGLLEQMQSEAEEAFQGRLQLARRQGEEASSRLLLPMMILFALVLGILMIPALFSF